MPSWVKTTKVGGQTPLHNVIGIFLLLSDTFNVLEWFFIYWTYFRSIVLVDLVITDQFRKFLLGSNILDKDPLPFFPLQHTELKTSK